MITPLPQHPGYVTLIPRSRTVVAINEARCTAENVGVCENISVVVGEKEVRPGIMKLSGT